MWPNTGRKFSKEWIRNLSESHKKYYENNPKAHKDASQRILKLWKNPEYRRKQMKSRGGRSLRVKMSRYWHLYIPKHYRSNSHGYVPEHIVLIEKKIGRRLRKNEVVHHIDGDRLNNNIGNLVVLSRKFHSSHHAKETGFGTPNHLFTKRPDIMSKHLNKIHKNFNISKWSKDNHGVSLKATPRHCVPPSTPVEVQTSM